AALAERIDRLRDAARHVTARVDDRVEAAPGERAEIAVAVAAELLDVGEEVGTGLPAVEQRHLVAVLERELDDVPPQELRPSEDEDPHTLTLCRRSFATPPSSSRWRCRRPNGASRKRGARLPARSTCRGSRR